MKKSRTKKKKNDHYIHYLIVFFYLVILAGIYYCFCLSLLGEKPTLDDTENSSGILPFVYFISAVTLVILIYILITLFICSSPYLIQYKNLALCDILLQNTQYTSKAKMMILVCTAIGAGLFTYLYRYHDERAISFYVLMAVDGILLLPLFMIMSVIIMLCGIASSRRTLIF